MSRHRGAWIGVAEPGWTLTFSYPATDAAGEDVIVDRKGMGSSPRVHVMAQNRDEIYFEVVRLADTGIAEAYASMQERLPEIYPDVMFEPLVFGDRSADGTFSWADQERLVRFLELADATYRIIFRPVGRQNFTILGTVRTSD